MLPRNQQVNWWSVHEHVAPLLEQVGDWPLAGTPEWCELVDGDPRKLAALLDAAQHHALRINTAQEARAAASQAISGAANWPAIANAIRRRSGTYIPRERVSP